MKRITSLVAVFLLSISCKQNKDGIEDLVVVNEKGIQENKSDTLSIEDVLKLESETKGLEYSYSSILTSSMEKSYPFSADSGQTVRCILSSDENKAIVTLYKEMIRTARVDSMTKIKIKDFSKIKEGDSVLDFSKKYANYKAVVSVRNKMGGDSTVKYTLNIYKN